MSDPASRTLQTSTRAPWRWALTGALGAALVTVLCCAPAAWLARAVAWVSGGQVLLLHARGTVWDGQAQLALTGGAGSRDRTELPSRLAWSLRPRLDGVSLRLHGDCCTRVPVVVHVLARWRGLRIHAEDSAIHFPASILHGLGTPWNTLDLRGQLQITTQALQWQHVDGRWSSRGSLRLDALSISSRLVPRLVLGSYRLDVQGGDVAQLQLRTLDGILQLHGQGQWSGRGGLHFRGEAAASAGREALLSNLLNIMGRRQGARAVISLG